MIDKNIIKVGDTVKIERDGLVSKDWTEITTNIWGDLMVGNFYLAYDLVTVTDHKPSLESYKAAIKAAQEKIAAAKAEEKATVARLEKELEQARDELEQAKNPNAFPIGTRVCYSTGLSTFYKDRLATVVRPPSYNMYLDMPGKIWIKFDGNNFCHWTTEDTLTKV